MSKVAEILNTLNQSPLAEHAKYIGHLCLVWSWLEGAVDTLLYVLMESDEADAPTILIYNMDFRDKLSAARALGYLKKPNDEWYAELQKLINEIDNELRPARNRMVHDIWLSSGDEVVRITKHAKVVREQARKIRLSFGEGKPMPQSDVSVLVIKVLAACGHMLALQGQHPNTERLLAEED